MNRRTAPHAAAIIACLVSLAGMLTACDRPELDSPPELRVGRDECGECGMIISEDRCACALLIERNGVREHLLLDDIGCLLDFEHEPDEGVTIVSAFVRDHDSRNWVPARAAFFVMADRDKLQTPMGSGIVAFATLQQAAELQGSLGGEVLDYTRLVPARRAWMEARYGKPNRAP